MARRFARGRARGRERPPVLGRLPDGAAPHHDRRVRRAHPAGARGARDARSVRRPGNAEAAGDRRARPRPLAPGWRAGRHRDRGRGRGGARPPARRSRRAGRPVAARPRAPLRARRGGAPVGGNRRRPAPPDGGGARPLGPRHADARRGGSALLVRPSRPRPDAPRAPPDGRPTGRGRPRLLGRLDVRRGEPLLPRPRPRSRPARPGRRRAGQIPAAGPRSASRAWRRSCRSDGSSLRSERSSGRFRS